jgi:hypothetical protein
MVNVYPVMNTTMGVLLYQWYAIDNKLHVSAIRWPSSGFEQGFEGKRASQVTFSLVLRSQTVLIKHRVLNLNL